LQVLTALRFIQANNSDLSNVPVLQFLQIALDSGDPNLFFTVFTYFNARVGRRMGVRRDDLAVFEDKFKDMFRATVEDPWKRRR
jgi:hypothetical protein